MMLTSGPSRDSTVTNSRPACNCAVESLLRVKTRYCTRLLPPPDCPHVCRTGSTQRSGVSPSVRLSDPSFDRSRAVRRVCCRVLSAMRTGDIGLQRLAPSSNGAAARHSAANAGSAMLIAELTRPNTDLSSNRRYRESFVITTSIINTEII